jgi:carbonic anhydrase
MHNAYPDLIPKILNIDLDSKKIFLEVDGPDFWQQANCNIYNYNKVLPNWKEQMLNIIKAHKSLGFYKYSMHPSSYFIVDGKLKSINYFFCHQEEEGPLVLLDYKSHIHSDRQTLMKEHIKKLDIKWDSPTPQRTLQKLCFDSFSTNYPIDFIEKAKEIYS